MSTRSEVLGKTVMNGIDGLETSAHNTVHAGAVGARELTKAGSRWASKHEISTARKARLMKRELSKQSAHLRRAASDSVKSVTNTTRDALAAGNHYVKRNPWSAIAIASGAAILVGALLSRRRS